MTSFKDLPINVLVILFAIISNEDLLNLGLTCKEYWEVREDNRLMITKDRIRRRRNIILACKLGFLDIVQELLDVGVNLHVDYDLPLRNAVQFGHVSVVKLLLAKGACAAAQASSMPS